MARMIHCVKLNKEAEGLAMPPLPGAKGQWLFEHVSQAAWSAWQAHQTRLINEKRLNLLEPTTRQYLLEQMDRYFANQPVDMPEGYTGEDH